MYLLYIVTLICRWVGTYIHISSSPCSSCAHLEEGGEVGHLDPSLPYHGNVLFHVVKWPKIGHRPPLTENKVIPLTLSVKNILGPHIPLKYVWHKPLWRYKKGSALNYLHTCISPLTNPNIFWAFVMVMVCSSII